MQCDIYSSSCSGNRSFLRQHHYLLNGDIVFVMIFEWQQDLGILIAAT